MNHRNKVMCCCSIAAASLIYDCSLPSDTENAQWQMYVEVPVVEKRFEAADLFSGEVVPGLEVSFGNNGATDTVSLIKTDTLHYSIDRELVSIDTSSSEKELGAVTLQNTPPVDLRFEMLESADPLVGTPLPVAVTLSQSKETQLDGIESVTFDDASPPMQVSVTNDAAQADLQNLVVTVTSGGETIGSISTGLLAANASYTASVPVAGKIILHTITVTISGTLPQNAIANTGDGLDVHISLDGLVASDAVIKDSMVDFTSSMSGEISLADGIILDAVDLDSALLLCEVSNPAAMKVLLSADIEDACKLDSVKSYNISDRGDLASARDSGWYAGDVLSDTLFKHPGEMVNSVRIPLKKMRLFPAWNEDSAKSVLKYRYSVTALSDGRNVHFRKNDVLMFKLYPDKFPFIKIKGTFVDPQKEEFSTRQDVGFDWESSILDSLKKCFRFSSVAMNLEFTPELPDSSSIDSLRLYVKMKTGTDSDDSVVVNKMLSNVVPDSIYREQVEIASLINKWPDTIDFNSQMILPSNGGIELYNEKDAFGNYSNTLSIAVAVRWALRIPLAWNITDTMAIELERSDFEMGLEDLKGIDKLDKKRVILKLDALNNTNLNVILQAVAVSEDYKQELDDLDVNPLGSPDFDFGEDSHLFSLLGDGGIMLASRGERSTETVELDERGIQAMLSKDKCYIRWFLVLPKHDPDALAVGDYLDLKASAAVEGVGNADSLLNWGDE